MPQPMPMPYLGMMSPGWTPMPVAATAAAAAAATPAAAISYATPQTP